MVVKYISEEVFKIISHNVYNPPIRERHKYYFRYFLGNTESSFISTRPENGSAANEYC